MNRCEECGQTFADDIDPWTIAQHEVVQGHHVRTWWERGGVLLTDEEERES